MRTLVAIFVGATLILTLVGCEAGRPPEELGGGLLYTHDDVHGVGCWYQRGIGGLSCLSDSDYAR